MSERSVEHATIVVERTLGAAPARVFAAWADPDARARWDVPGEGWRQVTAEHDFRVGGRDVIEFGPRHGPVYRAVTSYENLVPDARIVATYTVANGRTPMSVSVLTVEFLPVDTGTRMVLTEQAVFLDGNDSPSAREQGLHEMVDELSNRLSD